MAEYPDKEEQYLLRIQNTAVADRIRALLREEPAEQANGSAAPIELKFHSEVLTYKEFSR